MDDTHRKGRGPGRRGVDPVTADFEYSADELEFLRAIDAYRAATGRQFPTWTEALDVLRSLGYRKAAPPGPLPLGRRRPRADGRE